LAFQNGLAYRHSDFKRFIFDDLATLCVHLVNFGSVTIEFKIGKDVHPVVSFFKTRTVWQSLACSPRGIAVTPSIE